MLVVIGLVFVGAFVIGVPLAFALGLSGAVYIVFWEGLPASLLVHRIFFMLDSFPLLSIPLFIMIGFLVERTGLLSRLIDWLQMLVGWMKGGMAYINVLGSLAFAGVSGTAVSDVASLGRIEIELMRRSGYRHDFSCALTAATASIGPIFPPSVAMVIYALAVGNVSIGGLFLAGVGPGVLLAVALLGYAYVRTRKGNYKGARGLPSGREIVLATIKISPILGLPFIILWGVVGGIMTVTESAAVGVVYAILIGILVTRELRLRDLYDSLIYSAKMSSVVGMLLGSGAIVSWILTRNQVTDQVANFMISISGDPTVFLLVVTGVLLLIGMLMEVTAVIITLGPLLAPVALTYGVSDLHFGLVFMMATLLGMITPPVGVVLFLTAAIGEISLERLSRAIVVPALVEVGVIVLIILFPPLALWLPRAFGF